MVAAHAIAERHQQDRDPKDDEDGQYEPAECVIDLPIWQVRRPGHSLEDKLQGSLTLGPVDPTV
jgi:hypothetical protein